MARFRQGERASFPLWVRVHLVAARYGQTPAQVRDWPADDFYAACSLMEITA